MDSCCSNTAGKEERVLLFETLIALFSCKPGLRVQIRVHVCFLGQVLAFSLSQAIDKVRFHPPALMEWKEVHCWKLEKNMKQQHLLPIAGSNYHPLPCPFCLLLQSVYT